jgi:NAD-dependent dihydropyrimidine dehydrogenase PreA subunit/flavodoxin
MKGWLNMKATAIYFSPAGTTKKSIEYLAQSLEKNDIEVQLINITGDPDIFPRKNFEGLIEKVKAHDLLIIGGPVYIDHLHYNVADMLKAFPPAKGKWADKVCLLANFGKVTPGVALAEMSSILNKSGRKTVAALSIDAEHCISRTFKNKISQGLPGNETALLCEKAAQDLACLLKNHTSLEALDLTSFLQKQYDDFPTLADEKTVLAKTFPEPKIDYNECGGCLECVHKCPVGCLQEKDSLPYVFDESLCIHCMNCLVACPNEAVIMDISAKEDLLMKKLAIQGVTPDSPSRSQYYFCGDTNRSFEVS